MDGPAECDTYLAHQSAGARREGVGIDGAKHEGSGTSSIKDIKQVIKSMYAYLINKWI